MDGKKARPGLLATNRQIHAEALAMYYIFNTFCGLVDDQNYNGPSAWLADVSTTNIQLITTFTVGIRPSANLRRKMRAYQDAVQSHQNEALSHVRITCLVRNLSAATDMAIIHKYVQTFQAVVQADIPESAIVVGNAFKHSRFIVDFAGWEYFINFSTEVCCTIRDLHTHGSGPSSGASNAGARPTAL